jgi:DNA-directed RNA polymerase specialized sigma24 family protein
VQWRASHDNAGLRVELIRALESLPRDYLQVVLLRDFEGMSMDEIEAALGITLAAAKSRLHRARWMACEYLVG